MLRCPLRGAFLPESERMIKDLKDIMEEGYAVNPFRRLWLHLFPRELSAKSTRAPEEANVILAELKTRERIEVKA